MKKIIFIGLSIILILITISGARAALTDGLMHYYDFEDGPFDKQRVLNGTISSAVQQSGCIIGNCYFFDGSSFYIHFDGMAFGDQQTHSISVWMRANLSTGTGRGISEGAENGDDFWNFNQNGVDELEVEQRVGPAFEYNGDVTTGEPFNTTWHHIVFMDNSTRIIVYINGVKDIDVAFDAADEQPTGGWTRTTLGALGRQGDYSTHWKGEIDEWAVYNKTLTAVEISQLYNSGVGCDPVDNPDGCANALPNVTSITLTPAAPGNGDDLNLSFIVKDSNEDTLVANVSWFNGSVAPVITFQVSVTNGTSFSTYLTSSNTTGGQVWNGTVQPHDGTDFGLNASATVTIVTPVISGFRIWNLTSDFDNGTTLNNYSSASNQLDVGWYSKMDTTDGRWKACWKLNSAASPVFNDCNTDENGTTQGTPDLVSNEFIENALHFNPDEFINVSVTGLPVGDEDRTFGCWFKTYEIFANKGIFGWGTESAHEMSAIIGFSGDSNQVGVWIYGGGNDLNTDFYPDLDKWYHIVATYDGTTNNMSLFVNGTSAGTRITASDLATGSNDVYLNFRNDDSNPVGSANLTLDECFITNYTMTGAEVSNLYNSRKTRFAEALYSDRRGVGPVSTNQIKNITINHINKSTSIKSFRYNVTDADLDTSLWQNITSNGSSTITLNLAADAMMYYQFRDVADGLSTTSLIWYQISEGPAAAANTIPNITSIDLTPDSPVTGDDLNLTFIVEDVDDGDTLVANVSWFNGSVAPVLTYQVSVTNGTSFSTYLISTNTTKGETWNGTVEPHDGTGFGINKSDTVTIGNTAPTVDIINISSNDGNFTTGDLKCGYSCSDADPADTCDTDATFNWYNNSIELEVAAIQNSSTVNTTYTFKTQIWSCGLRVGDGTDTSAQVNSSNLTILNTAPVWATITNQTTAEDTGPANQWVNLSSFLSDVDPGETFAINIFNQTNSTLISCAMTDTWYLNCSQPGGNLTGESIININGTDGTDSTLAPVGVTVSAVNDLPDVDLIFPPQDDHHNKNGSSGNPLDFLFNVSDIDNATVGCEVWVNNSGSFLGRGFNLSIPVSSIPATGNISLNTSLADGNYTWYVTCEDIDGKTNSSQQQFFVDTTFPDWTINSFPAADNSSWADYYLTLDPQVDDDNLFRAMVNITNQTTYKFYTNFTDNIDTTTVVFSDVVNVTNWTRGTYIVELSATDDHTFGGLRNLSYNVENDGITFSKGSFSKKIFAGYYASGTLNFLTAPQIQTYDVQFKIKKFNNEYKFNMSFIRPATDVKFGFAIPKADSLIVRNNATGHFVWRDWYIDFQDLISNDFNISYLSTANYHMIYTNSAFCPVAVGEVCNLDPVVGGLNTRTEYYEVIIDRLPEATVNISSSDQTNRTNADIKCGYAFSDPDTGDAEDSNEVRWYNSSIEVTELKNVTLVSSGNTSKGQTWFCSVRVNDNLQWGNWSNSSTMTIANTVPTISNYVFNSTTGTNKTNTNLTLYFDYTDPDETPFNTTFYDSGNKTAVLVIDFNINSSDGVIIDLSTQGNNGTNIGTLYNATAGYDLSGAYVFDGNGDNMTLPASNTILTQNDTWTIMLWLNAKSIPAAAVTNAFTLHKDTTADMAVAISPQFSAIRLAYNDGSSDNTANIVASPSTDTWYHLVVTYDGSEFKTYNNGAAGLSPDDTFSGFNTFPAIIGSLDGNSQMFNGTVDDVRVYDYTMSAEQIAIIYGQGQNLIDSGEINKDDVWTSYTRLVDGDVYSAQSSASVTILNTAPTLSSVNISSDDLNKTSGNITIGYSATDIDGDTLTPEVRWFQHVLGGDYQENNTFANTSIIYSNNWTEGELWRGSLRVDDGDSGLSSWLNTTNISILQDYPTLFWNSANRTEAEVGNWQSLSFYSNDSSLMGNCTAYYADPLSHIHTANNASPIQGLTYVNLFFENPGTFTVNLNCSDSYDYSNWSRLSVLGVTYSPGGGGGAGGGGPSTDGSQPSVPNVPGATGDRKEIQAPYGPTYVIQEKQEVEYVNVEPITQFLVTVVNEPHFVVLKEINTVDRSVMLEIWSNPFGVELFEGQELFFDVNNNNVTDIGVYLPKINSDSSIDFRLYNYERVEQKQFVAFLSGNKKSIIILAIFGISIYTYLYGNKKKKSKNQIKNNKRVLMNKV